VVGAVALAAILVVVVLVTRSSGLADVQATVRAAGVWAPVLFVLLQVSITVAPVPRTVFTLAAGALFGSVMGVLVALLATASAAVVAFWLVRLAGAPLVQRRVGGATFAWVQARLDRSGLLAVASLRLIPALPFSVLNYAAGLSGVRFLPYLGGTLLGILPGTLAMVVLGDAVTGEPPPALLAVSAVSALIGLSGVVIAARRPAPTAPEATPDAPGPEPAT
jgi:uncharacterized membrane protein YdjX (TVP38/TMEM64 family)